MRRRRTSLTTARKVVSGSGQKTPTPPPPAAALPAAHAWPRAGPWPLGEGRGPQKPAGGWPRRVPACKGEAASTKRSAEGEATVGHPEAWARTLHGGGRASDRLSVGWSGLPVEEDAVWTFRAAETSAPAPGLHRTG